MKNEPLQLAEFVKLFNQREFFKAHEVLELCWRKEEGFDRDFYQGLIQIAAVFVHIQKETPEGGVKLFQSASGYLRKYLPLYRGLDLEKLLNETKASLFDSAAFPQLGEKP